MQFLVIEKNIFKIFNMKCVMYHIRDGRLVPSTQLLTDITLIFIISLKVCVKLTSLGLKLSDNFETVIMPLLKVVANHFKP